VEKKTGDNGQYLHDVIIHQKSPAGGNFTVIKSNNGELAGKVGSDVLSLILKDGNYYSEIQEKNPAKRANKPFAKSYFEEYVINIDISSFNDVDMEDENYRNSQNMLKISELNQSIDSMSNAFNKQRESFGDVMYRRTGAHLLTTNFTPRDTLPDIDNPVLELYDVNTALQVVDLALGTVNANLTNISSKKQEFRNLEKQLNKFEIALHEKYVLGFACVVLFFVGAPLGAIIRKGGMGLPMVVAILVFLTYHFIGIFAKNSAEEGGISPFLATWLSTLIMLPLGIFLTYRATTDQGLLQFGDFIHYLSRFFKKQDETGKETN
jgi:lipopolysaccharide export system permease protein